jgi:prevent-host-death family protein
MHALTATYAKTNFGELLQTVLTEPVRIEKNGRELAYVISSQEYHRMREAVQLSRSEFEGFLAVLDATPKPNAALKRAAKRYAKLVQPA